MKTLHKHFSQLFLIVAILFTFSLSAWGQTTVEMKTFTATSANMDNVISYSTAKGGGTAAPAVNSGAIRLYQNASGTGGGYITITAKEGYMLSSVTIGSSMATSVAHTIGSSTTKSSNSSLAKNGKHIISSINDQSVTIYCMGTTSSSRLYVNYLSVTYEQEGGTPSCTEPDINFASTEITKTNGDADFTNTLTKSSTGEVTYTSSNTSVATINATTGEVTIKGVGTTTITANVAADGTYCAAEASYTLTVNGRTFDITWMNGEETFYTTTYTEGETLNIPATDPASCSDSYNTFVGWYTQQAGTTSAPTTELSGTEASKTTINGPTTFYAVFGNGEKPTSGTNSIDFSKQGYANGDVISSATITDGLIVNFTKGTGSNNPAYYTTGTAIRVYAKGSFTITSTKNITSISLTFGSGDKTNEITVNCGNFTTNTWTGSSESVTFTVGGEKDHRRIKAISVTTESGTTASAYISTCDGSVVVIPDAPTFSPEGGDFTETQTVAIAVQDGAEIRYTINGDDPTISSTLYSSPIEVRANTTIKAIAVLNGVASSITEETYNINIVDNIEAFKTKAPTVNTKISGVVTVIAQDQYKQRTWIQDASGSAMIDNSKEDVKLVYGDQIKNIIGTFSENSIKVTTLPTKESTTGTPTVKETKTITSITEADQHKYIRIENVTFDGVSGYNATFTDETGSIQTYESYLKTDYTSLNEGQKVNLNAIVGIYNSTIQIYVVSFEVIKEPAIYSDDELNFGKVVEGNTKDLTTTITTVDLDGDATITITGANASQFTANPTTIENDRETEITVTFTAPDIDKETEYNATLTIASGDITKTIALSATVKPRLTLTASINGATQTVGTFAEGEDITEVLKAINVVAPNGWSFVGWTANAIANSQNTAPDYISTMPATAATVYAVFKQGEETQNTEVLNGSNAKYENNSGYCNFTATSTSGTWTGKANSQKDGYIQINTDKGHILSPIFSGNVTAIKFTTNSTKTTTSRTFYISSQEITSAPFSGDLGSHKASNQGEDFTITLTKDAKQFYIYSSGAVYIDQIEVTFESANSVQYRTSIVTKEINGSETISRSENVNSLTIYSGKTSSAQIIANETLTADVVTVEKTIDHERWYFFSLPFDCDLNDVVATHSNGTQLRYADSPTTGDYVINYYDQTRNTTTNKAWVELIGTSHTLKANQGYIIGHFGEGDVTVKFPSKGAVTISAPTTKTLNYTDSWTAGNVENSTNGWNLIGLPYYQTVGGSLNPTMVSIPRTDGTYDQTEYANAEIQPFTSFFVQTTEAPTFTIAAQQNAAPMLRTKGEVSKVVISLADANGVDDQTTIINNPNNTNEYEIGHDLAKWIGYAARPQIYSIQGDDILAFNSLAIDNSTIIPLGVYAHADGEYVFAIDNANNQCNWMLYDNETGATINLSAENYTVALTKGTHEGRFEVRQEQRIATDCLNPTTEIEAYSVNGELRMENIPANSMIYIYDAVGRMIYVTNNSGNSFNYNFTANGVYNIVVRSAENSFSFKTIY